jgi:hypothetical protein
MVGMGVSVPVGLGDGVAVEISSGELQDNNNATNVINTILAWARV